MAELQILTQFRKLFLEVKQTLDYYHENLRNDTFNKEEYETNDGAYQRGEGIFDQFDENLININLILKHENDITEFFNKCKENKQKIIEHKNKLIDKLLSLKKEYVTKEEYLNCREEWNKKREETPDEKNRRECEEMIEEMKEIKEMIRVLKEEREYFIRGMNEVKEERSKFSVRDEFNQLANEYVKTDVFNDLLNNFNILANQHNEIMSNYVKKTEMNNQAQNQQQNYNQINQQQPQHQQVPQNQNVQQYQGYPRPAPYTNVPQPMNNIYMPNQFAKIPRNQSSDHYNLTIEQMNQLEDWTELECGRIVFDSNVDNWSENTSIFDEKLFDKKHLLFLIEDITGEKFGYYLNTKFIPKYRRIPVDPPVETNEGTFHFNIQSNGRLKRPMKFPINDTVEGGYKLFEKTHSTLIKLGDICLYKENSKSKSYCSQHEDYFIYHGIEKALCGRTSGLFGGGCFTPKRILVIQMN